MAAALFISAKPSRATLAGSYPKLGAPAPNWAGRIAHTNDSLAFWCSVPMAAIVVRCPPVL